MKIELRQHPPGYWSLFVDGVKMVDRESLTLVQRIRDRLEQPELRDQSEASEVARSIADWYDRHGRPS